MPMTPEDARLLERWLTDASAQLQSKAGLQRSAFASSRSREAADIMAGFHEQAAEVYAKGLRKLKDGTGVKT